MSDFTKEESNNVSLIFDAIKTESINYSWFHYLKFPEMKKYLVHEKIEDWYRLRDVRTNKTVLASSESLEDIFEGMFR